jgi:release factor glutamine methyltransferase
VIVANPPYVAEGAHLQPELAHEPPTALFAGTDGLAAYREILPELPRRMAANGLFLGEIGQGQAPALGALARRAGMRHVSFLPDCSGRLRFLRAQRG